MGSGAIRGLWLFRLLLGFAQKKARIFRQVTFLSEPVFHRLPKLVERNIFSNLHLSIDQGQSVVKDPGIGEVAHGETVQPLQGAGKPPAVLFVFHTDLAGKHGLI